MFIHAAKIDENYSDKEEEIIKKTLIELGANKNEIDTLIIKAKENEEKANQILDYTKEIKLIPEMLNLLGCSKDNFKKLIQKMNYKIINKKDDLFFKYSPQKKFKKSSNKKNNKENPFGVLKDLNLR